MAGISMKHLDSLHMDDSITIRFRFTEQELLKSEERFHRLLHEILNDITSSSISDHDLALDRILGIMLQISGYDKGLFLLHTHPFYTKKAARGEQEKVCFEATVEEKDPVIKTITELKKPLFLSDVDLKYFGIPSTARTLLGIPIIFQEQVTAIAILYSDDQKEQHNINLKDLATFTTQAGIAMGYIRLFSEAKQLAIADKLTGLYNQTHLIKLAEIEYNRSERYNHLLSVFMINVDRFNEIKDSFGHAVGDRVLKYISRAISHTVRKTDIAGRYGGDGFMVVLPETAAEQAQIFADRLLGALLIEPFVVPGHGAILVTISVGISCHTEGTARFSDVCKRARKALHSSVKNGGNQVTTLI